MHDADGKVLQEGQDYSVLGYDHDMVAGTAHVTIQGQGDYVGLLEIPYTIQPRPVTVSGILAQNKTYDGQPDTQLDCSQAIFRLAEHAGSADSIGQPGASEGAAGAQSGSSASDSSTAPASGSPASDNATAPASDTDQPAVIPGDELTVTGSGLFDDVNVGTGKSVLITDLQLAGYSSGNYSLSPAGQQTTATADITPWDISAEVQLTATDEDWTGDPVESDVTAQVGDEMLDEGRDYTVEYSDNTVLSRDGHMGLASVTFCGNYTGASSVNFRVIESEAWKAYYEARKARINLVKKLIQDLPEVDDLTMEHAGAVEGAYTALQALPLDEQDDVGALDMSKLIKSQLKIESINHVWSDAWSTAGDQHWHDCKHCNARKDEGTHQWDAGVESKSANCTDDGEMIYTCEICGLERKETIKATGHKWPDRWTVIESPNCTDQGVITRRCETCGFTEEQKLDATGHVWETGFRTDKEPGCTTDGSESIHCRNCDANRESRILPAVGHSWKQVTIPAQIGISGRIYQTCTVCGEEVNLQSLQALRPGTPKKMVLKSGKKQLKVSWTAVRGGVSYQYAYRLKGKSWKTKYTRKDSLTIKKLKSKKYYYVKVRAYKKVGGQTYYGAWSASKKAKVK